MENAHQPELWHDFFVVLGSSSAALIGLLFIATSLHLGEIVNDPILRRRAFNNTLFLLMAFVSALLVLIPQPMPILGAELIAINLLGCGPSSDLSTSFLRTGRTITAAAGRFTARSPLSSVFYSVSLEGRL